MGTHSVKAIESLSERKDFLYHLLNDVKALDIMIEEDLFEKEIHRVGAEQELCLVDKNFRPSNNALKVLDKIDDEHFTTELALLLNHRDFFYFQSPLAAKLLGNICSLLAWTFTMVASISTQMIMWVK